jgi:hypothetical protein
MSEAGLLTEVDGCPCGDRHLMTTRAVDALKFVTAGLPATVRVEAPGGAWLVPRLFIACHGLKAGDLADLAERYGFERADA